MEEKGFQVVFSKRSAMCFFLIALLFFFCILRVAAVAVSDYATVQKNQSTFSLTAGKLRGTIYDRSGKPLTNADKKIMAVISPTPRALAAVRYLIPETKLQNVETELKKGKPVLCEISHEVDCDGVVCFSVYEHTTENTPAIHLIGTVDGENRGVSGLERAYDDILYHNAEITVSYTMDGSGKILSGIEPEISYDQTVLHSGIVTTLDAKIQEIAGQEAQNLEVGAILVAETKTSEILAMVSRPTFNTETAENSLNDPDSPFLNRAISAYHVGSVFKPCVAAAGIKSGNGSFTYTCTGSYRIIDRYFRCHKTDGHGNMDLESGLANSCNTYFYNFAFLTGADSILSMASSLNFGRSFSLCRGIDVAKGRLPKAETLVNPAQLANFGIGQGELSLSPVVMLNLYNAIASDGSYCLPSVVRGKMENGLFRPQSSTERTRVMSKETALTIRHYLQSVITDGTGITAAPERVTAAGKTATAQTGKYKNGTEICEGWFCGFFPAEEPKYTIIVFSEDTRRQTKNCGEIFARIADRIICNE